MARSSNESGKRKPEEDLCNSEKKAKKKIRLDPVEEKVDSIRQDVDSIRKDVDAIREDVDSMKAKLDLVLKAVLTPKKVKPASMKQSPEYIPSSSDSSANEQYLMPKTLYAANLAYNIKKLDVEDFFKDVGKIVDVKFQRRQYTALIEFSSTEEVKKALDLKGNIFCQRPVHLARASNSIRTIYFSGLNRSLGGGELKKQLRHHFRGCGKIHQIRLPMDEYGHSRGMGFLDISGGRNDPVKLDGVCMEGCKLVVSESYVKSKWMKKQKLMD